ncbi:hypothetical protein AK812_SmicGene11066 [Symbiodinium microadriaticum]|uniref:RNase H type-1 domain-containing protein n=1 Tax=Symbiodinium microadriaticum TaxID=2951 RepID=A0A1Q9EE68_SYMMI|nr:hypothetical protein AK812_SmicGene11066 [Symbiodinium microadriaticum]
MESSIDTVTGGDPARRRAIQKALTTATKADTRVRKLKEEIHTRRAQWSQYQKDLYQKFATEQRRFETDIRRLEGEVASTMEAGQEAARAVHYIAVHGLPETSEPDDEGTYEAWQRLISAPPPRPAPAQFLTEAMNAARNVRVHPQGLQQVPPAAVTSSVPLHQTDVGDVPMEQAHMPNAAPPAAHAAPTYAENEHPAMPFQASPGNTTSGQPTAPTSVTPEHRRPPAGTRTPIKAHTKPPPANLGSQGLEAKLEQKRNAMKPFGGAAQGGLVENPEHPPPRGVINDDLEDDQATDEDRAVRLTFERRGIGVVRHEDPQRVPPDWIGVSLFAPYYQPEHWGIKLVHPASPQEVHEAVRYVMQDAFKGNLDTAVPINPQRFYGNLHYLCFPSFLDGAGSSGVAVVIDASRVGGHYFATILAGVLMYEQLAAFLRPLLRYGCEDFVFTVGGATTQFGPGSHLTLNHGDVVTAILPAFSGPSNLSVAEILSSPTDFSPLHQVPWDIRTPCVCLLYQGERYLLEQTFQSGRNLSEAVSFMIDLEDTRWIAHASSLFDDLDVQGTPCDRLLAAFRMPPAQPDDPVTKGRRDIWLYLDFRPLGHRPQALITHVFRVHVPSLLAHFRIIIPDTFQLEVIGGVCSGDEVLLETHTTLTFKASRCVVPIRDDGGSAEHPRAPPPPDADDDEPESSSSTHEDATGEPHTARPRSRVRSRTPRRDGSPDGPTATAWVVCSINSKVLKPKTFEHPAADALTKILGDRLLQSLLSRGVKSAESILLSSQGPYHRLWCPLDESARTTPTVFQPELRQYAPCKTMKGYANPVLHIVTDRVADAADRDRQVDAVEQETQAQADPRRLAVPVPAGGAAQVDMLPLVDVRCLIYAPEYVPDMLIVPIAIPCSVEHATAMFVDVRDESQAESFENIVPATPQPVRECAIYVAVPSWLAHKVVVLFNLQAVNDCIFSAAVHPRLNKASLLIIAEIRDPERYEVYVHGLLQPLPPELWIDLHNGYTITVVATGRGPPPQWILSDMLQDQEGWDHLAHVPGPGGSPGDHFWVLNDGMPFRFSVQVGRRAYVRQDICKALRFEQWRTTLKPSSPRIIDHLSCGFISSGVIVATELLSCVPCPPARVPELRKILMLDCRAILQSFQWQCFTGDHVILQTIADRFADVCPVNFLVVFKGADIVHTPGGLAMNVQHGTVIKVEFQEETLPAVSDDEGETDDVDVDSDISLPEVSPETHPERPPCSPQRHDETGDRSRSPRQQDTPQNPAETISQAEATPATIAVETAFAVLRPGFPLESVEVTLQIPSSIEVAMNVVQQARCGSPANDFPHLVPVIRQPDACWGVLLALPAWKWWPTIVCFYVCLGHPRLFACECPARVTKTMLLQLAGHMPQPPAAVFCDLYGPLEEHEECNVYQGSTITILPEGHPLPWTIELRDMLQTHLPWYTPPAFPQWEDDASVLLACQHGQELFAVHPARAMQYRQDIAALVCCHTDMLHIAAATPRPSEVEYCGHKCRTVVAAVDFGPFSVQTRPSVCLLDARAILKGWIPVLSEHGWVDVWSLLHEIGHEVGRNWVLRIAEHNASLRWYHTQEGSVMTLICESAADSSAPCTHASRSDCYSDASCSAAAQESRDHTGDCVTTREDDNEKRQQNPSASNLGPPAHRALQSIVGCAMFGANAAQRVEGAIYATTSANATECDKWSFSLLVQTLAEGGRYLTPVLLGIFIVALLVYCLSCPRQRATVSIGSSPTASLLLYAILFPVSAASGVPPQGLPCTLQESSSNSYMRLTARPLPTPCRGHGIRRSAPPANEQGTNPEDIDEFSADTLITLLEQSVLHDKKPFFLASTLLETLTEHFLCADEESQNAALHIQDSPRAIPCSQDEANESDLRPVQLHLHQALGPETFDLTAHTVQLPHNAHVVEVLTQVWPPTWLAPAQSSLTLPETTRTHLTSWTPWPAFVASLPTEAQLNLHLYTDGSWSSDKQVGGYAVVIVLEWKEASALYGIIGEKTHGQVACPWPLDGPPALRNEEVAVAAALLWLAQSNSLCRPKKTYLHYDCFGAGLTAAGEWNPSSDFASKVRDLQRWIDVLLEIPVQYIHVKAHNGHPLNDAADAFAKQVSQDQAFFGCPPRACADFVCQIDLSWLATAFRRDARWALPFKDVATMQWGEELVKPSKPLLPEELVPTKPAIADAKQGSDRHFELCAVSVNVQGFGGQQKYIEEQLEQYRCNIVFVQETKTSEGTCHSRAFMRLSSPAQKHWGTSIWISKTRGLFRCGGQVCHVDESDVCIVAETERLMLITMRIGAVQICAFSAHCPHSAKQPEALAFLGQLQALLMPYRRSSLIIGGVDLNGRPCVNTEYVTGDLAYGNEDATGIAATRIFAELGIWLPSTYSRFHTGSSATYRHPTGAEHRIDFVVLGGTAAVQETHSHVIQDFDNGSAGDDHYPVRCQLTGHFGPCSGGRRLKRTKYDVDRMLSPTGKTLIADAIAKYQSPSWGMHPDEHCQHLTLYLQSILDEHFQLPGRRPRATYIPSHIWQLRDTKIALKLQSRHRCGLWSDLLPRAFLQWKTGEDYCVSEIVGRQGILYQIISLSIKFATARIKKEIRTAKAAYLQGLVHADGDGACDILHKAKQAGVGGQKSKSPFRPLPVLFMQDGKHACDRADRDQVWLRHFGEQEYGHIIPVEEFAGMRPEPIKIDDDLRWEYAHLPSQGEIESVLRQLPRNKAAGLDMVPGELLKAAPGPMAAALQPLMAKSAANIRQPIQWRGGLLFEAWKRSSSQKEAAAYRSLYVASTVGKVYHKVMRKKVQGAVECNLHDFHLGARKQAPVSMPALYVLAHQRLAADRGLSSAILFLDTHAAYYRLVRDLAVGCIYSDAAIVRLFKHFSLDEEDLREMMSVIAEGGTFADANIPSAIRHAAKDMHHFTWFVTPHTSGDNLCRTAAGSRPGESWADTVYSFIYGRVLNKIGELARGEEITPTHCRDSTFGIYAAAEEGEPIDGQDATWADDSAWPIVAPTPLDLLNKASRLCSLVLSQCMSHGMKPNLGRNKTALMFVLRGKGAVQAVKSAFKNGQSSLHLSDLDIDVPTTSQYKHLGGIIDHKTQMSAEARQRLAIATQAFDKGQTLLYLNSTIPLKVRAALLQTTVTATFHNLALWIPEGPSWQLLSNGYARLVKKLLSKQFPGDVYFKLPAAAAYIITGCIPLEILARKARLSLLVSMCKAGPAALWASLQTEQSWFTVLRQDLQWLVGTDHGKWPKLCGAAWPEWSSLMSSRTSWFKRQVRSRVAEATEDFCRRTASGLLLWALHKCAGEQLHLQTETTGCTWICGPCGRRFKTKGAMGAHFFKTHGRRAKYRAVVQGSYCAACGRQYRNTNRLARHLRDTPACAATLRAHRMFAEVPAPGFGSRGWRKEAVDNFHPAVPQQQDQGLEAQITDDWDDTQKAAHLALCEVLLGDDLPATAEEIAALLKATVTRFPLYEDEAKHLLDFVHQEAREVRSELLDHGWTSNTEQEVTAAVESLLSAPWHAVDQIPRRDAQVFTYEDIFTTVSETNWSEIWTATREVHGTPEVVQYELEPSWEADLRASCRAIDVSAVHNHLLPVVPRALRDVWDTVLSGGVPRLSAPCSFWQHSAAAPFAPFAAHSASN